MLGDGIDPWLLAGLLYLGSGIGLALVHLTRGALGIPAAEAPLRRADLPWLGLVVPAGGVAGPVLLMLGLARTPASSAALLLNLEGLATMTIACVAFRENVDRRLLAGALTILAGAALLSWQGGPGGVGLGALAIAGACLAWGVDNNLTRRLSSADPVQIAAIKGLVAGAVNLALALGQGAHLPPIARDPAAAGVVGGFFGYGVGPGAVRAGAAASGAGTHRLLLLHRPVPGRDPGAAAVSRAGDAAAGGRRRADGRRRLAAPGRTSRARTPAHRAGTRAPAPSTTSTTSTPTGRTTRPASPTPIRTATRRCATSTRTTRTCTTGTDMRTDG